MPRKRAEVAAAHRADADEAERDLLRRGVVAADGGGDDEGRQGGERELPAVECGAWREPSVRGGVLARIGRRLSREGNPPGKMRVTSREQGSYGK